jgi:hypothetical protein
MPAKSLTQKSEALAKARKALRQFSGELAAPIPVTEPGPGLAAATFLEREIAAQRNAKLELLFKHYNIQSNDKDRWVKLSGCLAADFVPGMITIKQHATEKWVHKNKGWGFKKYSELVRDVDAIRAKSGRTKIHAVVGELSGKWRAYTTSSLVTRYHEGRKMMKQRTQWEASARPLWEPPTM